MKLCLRAALGVAAVSFFALPASIRAQDSSHHLTAMDEFQLQLATDPQISPDGRKIVYVHRFADPMTDKRFVAAGFIWRSSSGLYTLTLLQQT